MDVRSVSAGTMMVNGNIVTISGLSNGQNAQVSISLKQGIMWTDGSTTDIDFKFTVLQTTIGLTKPKINNVKQDPTTTTTTDGKVTFTIIGDISNMNITNIGNGNVVIISGLSNGQNAQISVVTKSNQVWTNGSTVVVYSNEIGVSMAETAPTSNSKKTIIIMLGVISPITLLFIIGLWIYKKCRKN